jgi:hypothetical protein
MSPTAGRKVKRHRQARPQAGSARPRAGRADARTALGRRLHGRVHLRRQPAIRRVRAHRTVRPRADCALAGPGPPSARTPSGEPDRRRRGLAWADGAGVRCLQSRRDGGRRARDGGGVACFSRRLRPSRAGPRQGRKGRQGARSVRAARPTTLVSGRVAHPCARRSRALLARTEREGTPLSTAH